MEATTVASPPKPTPPHPAPAPSGSKASDLVSKVLGKIRADIDAEIVETGKVMPDGVKVSQMQIDAIIAHHVGQNYSSELLKEAMIADLTHSVRKAPEAKPAPAVAKVPA